MAAAHNGKSGTQMAARIRSKGVDVPAVEVLDLSLAGCMVRAGVWLPRVEQKVFITLPGIANLPATVLWVENGRAGVLFDQLLSEVVYEHLIADFVPARED